MFMIEYLVAHREVGVLVIVWTLLWKGFALWRAGRLNQKYWFIALFIINTFGLLEILYLYIFSKQNKADSAVDAGSPGLN